MGPTVIFEEDEISLLEPSSAPEVDVATTATTQNLTGNVNALISQPAAFARWESERVALIPQIADAKTAFETHTGLNDWHAYLKSPNCLNMMKDLLTVPFVGLESQLVQHWRGFFVSKVANALAQAFKEKARAEIFVPTLIEPGPKDPLNGRVVSYKDGAISSVDDRFLGFLAVDERFKRGVPLVLLSWGDYRPWSIIIPGKGFVQTTTFHYTDKNGKKWDSGQVISEVYLRRLEVDRMLAHFAKFRAIYSGMTSYFSAHKALKALTKRVEALNRKVSAWQRVSLSAKTLNEILQRVELFEMGDPAAPSGLLLDGPPGTGKTTIAESLADSMQCNFVKITLADVKQRELGGSSQKVREIWNQARQNQPTVLFFDEGEGVFGRRGAAETDVVADEIVKTILAEWNDNRVRSRILVIGATNRPDMIDNAILSRFDWKMTISMPDRNARLEILTRELQALNCTSKIPEEMSELTQGMSGRDLHNLAKDVRSLAHPNLPTDEHFYQAVQSKRKTNSVKVDAKATWQTLAVGPKTLSELKLICQLVRNAESWKEKGIEVPQSLLLHGPPGTGKTQIGRTLANESGLSFLMATTADLKANFLGQSGNRVKLLFERARVQAPAILFLDELDVVAPKRGGSNDPMTEEIVGQLLQEMDGIQRQDSQVFVVAATNAPGSVDRAILSRFLKKIEVPLPDHQGRAKLLSTVLEKKKLSFDLATVVEELAGRTEGKNHRDLLGLVGAAEEKALMRAIANGGPEHFAISVEDFN